MSVLFNLYRVVRGKKILMMTDEQSPVRRRKAQLQQGSPRCGNQLCKYVIEPATGDAVKFKKTRDDHKTSGQAARSPRLTKWD